MMRERKRRRPPRALRFANLKAGDILIWRRKHVRVHYPKGPFVNDNEEVEVEHHASFVLVTDRWFDPCLGQVDPIRGEMAGVRMIGPNGAVGTKLPYTLRGLAMQRYEYATPEQAQKVSDFVCERVSLLLQIEGGTISVEEARLKATPYRELIRGI